MINIATKLLEKNIKVINTEVSIMRFNDIDYISLTDISKYVNKKDPSGVIRNWMSNKTSFLFYSLWEEINNKNFNSVESHRIKMEEVGLNRFTMTPSRWKKEFNAIGIVPSRGKYSSGTYAHPDIAFEFASWLSPEFKLYLITEFERLKRKEAYEMKTEWDVNRLLSKMNYLIHTDAIKQYIVPNLTENQKKYVYADEADVLNVALFGMTSKEWKKKNSLSKKDNIRNHADLIQLVILNNLQNINAIMIEHGILQHERLIKLNEIAKKQIELLKNNKNIESLRKIYYLKK